MDYSNAYAKTLSYYRGKAQALFDKYEETTTDYFDFFMGDIAQPPAKILDIGSGSGKDAAVFAEIGYQVTAIEPAEELRALAAAKHTSPNIVWVDDSLPALKSLDETKEEFDHVHINCVLMHMIPADIPTILEKLHRALKPGGTLYISLRQGPNDPERPMFPITVSSVVRDGKKLFEFIDEQCVADSERLEIMWDRLLLQKKLPPNQKGKAKK